MGQFYVFQLLQEETDEVGKLKTQAVIHKTTLC